MKIALINENSQAAKNELVESVLKKVVEPMGHEVINYGMYSADDENQLTYVQNTGAAFSLFSQHTWLLTLLSGVVSVVLVICLGKRLLPHWSGMLALALLLGGAVGNFIDRLLFGFVTDMFATTFVNFAVFNVADVGVVLGGVLLCLHLIVFFGREGKKEPDKEETP